MKTSIFKFLLFFLLFLLHSIPVFANNFIATYLGGSVNDQGYYITKDSEENIYVVGSTRSLDFPVTQNAYGTTTISSNYNNCFISKFNSTLTTLLASTYIRFTDTGNYNVSGIAIDSNDNVFVAIQTDTNNTYNCVVAKYDKTLTNLLANTTFTQEYPYGIAISPVGSVYIVGRAGYDGYIRKLKNDLTIPTYGTNKKRVGGSGWDSVSSVATDLLGNVYVTGYTKSPDFSPMDNAYYGKKSYDNTFNSVIKQGGNNGEYLPDAFVVKFGGDLSDISGYGTYLGAQYDDEGKSIAVDSSGNVYVTGIVGDWSDDRAPDFPVTKGAYDTTFNRESYSKNGLTRDIFVSKFDTNLTTLLASTFLGGGNDEAVSSLKLDSDGTIYVAGKTNSQDFPLLTNIWGTPFKPHNQLPIISKFNSNLTNLLASTFLGEDNGGSNISVNDIVIDSSKKFNITGYTTKTDLSDTNTYDTTLNGSSDAYVLKGDFSGESFESTPLVITKAATNIKSNTATLNGSVNSHGIKVTVWFEYGITNEEYIYSTTTQALSSNDDANVSMNINGLTAGRSYYYRLAANNNSGNTYGDEMSFNTLFTSTPTPTPTPIGKGSISGNVIDTDGNPIKFAKIGLKAVNTNIFKKTISNEKGFFEFTDLDAGTYIVAVFKKGYKKMKQRVMVEAGKETEIEIEISP